jgi:hypothetical protein
LKEISEPEQSLCHIKALIHKYRDGFSEPQIFLKSEILNEDFEKIGSDPFWQ